MFFFLANLLGVGLGPTVVALITDYVFRNEHAVGYSITVANLAITPVVAVLLWWGLRPFRESLARSEAWASAPGN